MRTTWVVVRRVPGRPRADLIRRFLESNGIPTDLSQEAVGVVHGPTMPELERFIIRVPAPRVPEAVKLLRRLRQPVPKP